jgi:hypothetical protein
MPNKIGIGKGDKIGLNSGGEWMCNGGMKSMGNARI